MKKKRNYYNLIFYGLVVSYVLVFISLITVFTLFAVLDEADQTQELGFAIVGIGVFVLFLVFLFTNLAGKYQRKFTIKIIKKCKSPIIIDANIHENELFQKKIETLGYQLWNDIELDVPIYIKRVKNSFLGMISNDITIFILYENSELNRELLNKIKEDRKKIISKLRSEKLKEPYLQLGTIVNLETSNDMLQSYISKTVPQLMNTSILECFLAKDNNKVYIPRIFMNESSCNGIKKILGNILNIQIKK